MSHTLHPLITQETNAYKRIAVFGAGVSGRSAQKLVIGLGLEVCVFDEGEQGDASEFNEQSLKEFDAFIFSPGFAATHSWRILAEGASQPCYSELGFAALHWRGRLIGITGTNGKTSLTSLLFQSLETAGIPSVEAGNIGRPLSDFVLSDANTAETYAVCEISSFQAELTRGLQLDGLAWTNFAEDHLDRHVSMEDYFAAKRKLITCLRPGAPAFLGASVRAFDPSVCNRPTVFIVEEGSTRADQLTPESLSRKCPQSANFALAAALWDYFDWPMDSLIASANSFQPAEHRLGRISEWSGVSFWNDSKATNFHAALAAIDAIVGKIYWIGGGSYKGGNLEAFVHAVDSKIKKAFLYGSVAEEMANHFRKTDSCFELHIDFVEAVRAATKAALKDTPSVVLLSPGFASFDQFSGYAARGDAFQAAIFELKDNCCTA